MHNQGIMIDLFDGHRAYLVQWPTPKHCLLIAVGEIDFLDSANSGKAEFYCKRFLVEPSEFWKVVNNCDDASDSRRIIDRFSTLTPVKLGFEPWEGESNAAL